MGYCDPMGNYVYDQGEPYDPNADSKCPKPTDPTVPFPNEPGPTQSPPTTGGADLRPPKQIMIERDREEWRSRLITGAKAAGFTEPAFYTEADTELQQVVQDVLADAVPGGTNPSVFIAAANARMMARGPKKTVVDPPKNPGDNITPKAPLTPDRITMPVPERNSIYTPAFKASMVQAPTEVGRPQRDRILNAVLDRPETMDQRMQDSLFESQKELATSLAEQQRGRLAQSVLGGGFASVGGRSLAGQSAIEETMGNTLLGARRDVAVKAAETNRRDQLAALEMQSAIAQGDHTRALDIFKANEASRVQEQEFLSQAADLNSRNLNSYNDAMLRSAMAQQGGNMDYFQFLEMQRQFEADLKRKYFDTAVNSTRPTGTV